MLGLARQIEVIEALLSKGDTRSLRYAALECRFAIEQVINDRLETEHDYLSKKDLKGWQPGAIVNSLIEEVEPPITSTKTVSMCTKPVQENTNPTLEDHQSMQFINLGCQIGFNATKLKNLWHAMGSFLHAKLSNENLISEPIGNIKKKVNEVLDVLRHMSQSTASIPSFGKTVSFHCSCGTQIKRLRSSLQQDKIIHCFNENCQETYRCDIEGGYINFEPRKLEFRCKCGGSNLLPKSDFEEKQFGNIIYFSCALCGLAHKVEISMRHSWDVGLSQ